MWLEIILEIFFFIHGTTFALPDGLEKVDDVDRQIPEFLFDCLTKKYPWISPCSPIKRYFMIFDSQGNFFQEKIDQSDNTHLRTSYMKKARKPTGKQIIEIERHPNYLFELEEVGQKKGTFYIAAGSGRLLVAGNEVNPSLLLREDHCGKESTTESPVTVTSTTTTGASITTLASTESPVTAIAIATPEPNMDYACEQAQWRLWKDNGRFLLVESVNKPGFFFNVDSVTHMIRLGIPEKMTGIYTSFITNITLDRSGGLQPETGIGAEAYGDLVVHYFGRDGSQQSGYVCDYEWGQESADAVCKYLGFGTGIPTFDGRYSSTNSPEYAVSEVKCDSENLEECQIRTICGPSSSCLSQNSMKAFGGKGYACNRGSATDVAGVVCGDQAQILNVLKQEVSCDRTSLGNDRKSVAAMHNIQTQMKRVRSTMFENKHWSEYLLPMPMAVSLIQALLLVSSQNDRDVELVKPSKGYWDYLKYDNIMANLLFLSHNVTENFLLSNDNMGVIKVNSRRIHRKMLEALQNAFSTNKYDYKTLLPRNLKRIAEDANMNKEKAEEVYTVFSNTNKIIDELLQALINTEGFQQNKRVDTEKALNILNSTYNRNQEELEKNMLEKQQYDAAVKKSKKAFFDAAREAINSQCVDETLECNNCTWVQPKITGICKPDKTEQICVEWNNPNCVEYETICTGGWATRCVETYVICYKRFIVCTEHRTRCRREEQYCRDWTTLCKRNSPNITCKKWKLTCTEYVYEPAESGSYCQDNGKIGKLCTACKWSEEVLKNLKNVADVTMKMQQSVSNDENSYSGVASVIGELVSQVNKIDQDVQNYNQLKASPQNAPPLDNATRTKNIETKALKLEPFDSSLKLIKLSVNLDIDLLSHMKIPIAKKTRMYAFEVNRLLDSLIATKHKHIGEMTEKENISVTSLLVQGKTILKLANKVKAKYEVSIKAAADHKTGEQANILLEDLTNQHKTNKKIESLSNRMSSAISEMFKQQVEKQDINSIITKLVQCSRYLNFLSEQWIELRIFFKKMSNFLEILKTSIKEMSEFYTDMGVNIPKAELTKSFKDGLQRGIVDSLVNNIFVGRIAFYYTKIAEDGLLKKMASIGNYMEQIGDPVKLEKLKKYIEDESIMINQKIKLEVSKEEARISDRIMKDVSSIKNDLACKLIDAQNLTDTTVSALKIVEEGFNKHQGIVGTISNASPTEISKMNLFDNVHVELETEAEKIQTVDIGFDEEEEEDPFA